MSKNYMKIMLFLSFVAGILGYIVNIMSADTLNYLPSQIIVTGIWPAAIMYSGLIVGYNIGRGKKNK